MTDTIISTCTRILIRLYAMLQDSGTIRCASDPFVMQGNLLERGGSERRALAADARAARRLARTVGRVGEREAPVRDRGRPRRQPALLVRRRNAAHRSGHLRRL